MPHDDLALVGHMVDMAKIVQQLTAGVTRQDLDHDVKLQLALVRALQVIGEAAWRTSAEFQAAHPPIPWAKIAGFRHRVVHEYFSIDYDVVWRVATAEMQPLIDYLSPLVDPPPPTPAPPPT